jgi:murein DD-endopeptidase MepM/ murein hydrolase activator NlpD
MRYVLGLVALLILIVAAAFVVAGRQAPPGIEIGKPDKFVGMSTPLDVTVGAPGGKLASLTIVLEQNGKQVPLYSLGQATAEMKQDGPDKLKVTRDVGKGAVPELQTGAAKITVTAGRQVLYGMRTLTSTASKDVQVRLERPRVAVLSNFHYVNLGGSEMIVYTATPSDVQSGVMVGDTEYPGFPAAGAKGLPGFNITDPNAKIAFFALRFDQDLNTPMHLFARDEAGNTARADFDFKVFPKTFKKSRIEVSQALLDQVVPAILQGTTEITPTGEPIEQFVAVNSELRKKNNEKIASMAKETSPGILWVGNVFHPFANNAVESAFADYRTYVYDGKDVDQQVHLGFDLASFTNTPIVAANAGRVLFAQELGIYGNCVIIDHGMGVQSLYAHLSSFDVKPGDRVRKEQLIGKSGRTGMALGDHLHFTMLVSGQMVNPVEWWDPHWIQDRILRKLR